MLGDGDGDEILTPTPVPLAPNDLAGVRVLIVEDDANNAKLLAVVLREEGCDVQIARNAEDALALLPVFRPEAVVVDLILPLMSGLLLAQRIKSDTATSDLCIIAVSAFNGPEVERLAHNAGCAAYLRKPIDPFGFAGFLRKQLHAVRPSLPGA